MIHVDFLLIVFSLTDSPKSFHFTLNKNMAWKCPMKGFWTTLFYAQTFGPPDSLPFVEEASLR